MLSGYSLSPLIFYLTLIFLFLFFLHCDSLCMNLIYICFMITVMKSLFLEAEISQYLIMVSDLKPVPIFKCLDLIFFICLDKFALVVVMFFRFVTSAEIQKRSEFFEPFILGLTNTTVEQVCSVLRIFSVPPKVVSISSI